MNQDKAEKKRSVQINNTHITVVLIVALFIVGQIILSGFASMANISNIVGFAVSDE